MGYDIERFVGPVNEGLLCCICRDVLQDPLQAPCEHAFCKTCIEGWLVNEVTCPEDRQILSSSRLKPLFRYMKNDLDRLQIYCTFKARGCPHISKLEFLPKHESECPYATVSCPNERCSVLVSRRDLEKHLNTCEFQKRECSKGCGIMISSADERKHNCIAELRTMMDSLRSEFAGKMAEQKREMELRLNMQRGHMVQKEAAMQGKLDEMKSESSKLSQKVKLLMDSETQRRQDMEKLEIEKKELIELLRGHRSSSVDRSRLPRPGTSKRFHKALQSKVTEI
ncbi:hypothetical protein FSP39_012415 [Pinctada imbricata]|uniref:Uncharacterized protein n=1 Tax=Pinctada imbricata TaxID=66713 RepID=A0AA88XIW4_PINIB|nr:hypothetical protein FSP39_012415 [Pinctada imbricata]